LVPPAVGGERVTAADGIAVAALAPNLLAPVLANGVVADQLDPLLASQAEQDQTSEPSSQAQALPLGVRQDAVEAGGVALGQAACGAEKLANRPSPARPQSP